MKIIKKKRMSMNMTQKELAKQMQVGRSAVAMWEIGESVPKTKMLVKLAKILDVKVEDLLKQD